MVQGLKSWVLQLSEEYLQICFSYRLKLKKPVIEVRDMGIKWGQWDPETRTLSLSAKLIENYAWNVVLEILKHEMAHQYVSDILASDESHGPQFHLACEKLGISHWARKAESDMIPREREGEAESAPSLAENEERLMRRVEKLLALANSQNEHESLLAMQKVQEIYTKYNLTRLQEKQKTNYLSVLIHTGKKRLDRYQYVIASILNEHFFVEVIHSILYDSKKMSSFKVIELLGSRENVQMAEYVYHFLMNQTRILWNQHRKSQRHLRARNSYLLGVVSGFRDKLDLNRKEIHQRERENYKALNQSLVIKKDPELEGFVRTRYPRLVKINHAGRTTSADHYHLGREHGSTLVLNKGLKESKGFLNKLLPNRRG